MMNENVKAIYTVTAIRTVMAIRKDSPDIWAVDDSRCFGWYADYETTEESVINNETDIWETYYNYAVIEKVYEGLYGTSYSFTEEHGQVWFKYNEETGKYDNIEKPEWAKNIFGWGIG